MRCISFNKWCLSPWSTKNLITFIALSLLIVMFSISFIDFALAQGQNPIADDPLGQRLCAILKIMMGPTAKAIATIAIIFVAIGLFAGRMTWLTVIPIIIGIIVIFSAPALVKFVSGAGDEACTVPN